MLSSVLHSQRAVQVNIAIMRAFVRLRETLSLHNELARRLAELEPTIENHDESMHSLFEAIRQRRRPNPRSASTAKWIPSAAASGKGLPNRDTQAARRSAQCPPGKRWASKC
jgi:hypothetical protein